MKIVKNEKTSGLADSTEVDYQAELNSEQYQVVSEAEGPCLVLAGAGSGKTRTIVYRVAYLLEQGIRPENVLLLTFTNKAAKEMIGRVEKLLKKHPRGLWSGTFHGIANRILSRYATELGYQNNFNIIDGSDSKDLIKACLKDLGIDTKQRRFPSPAIIKDLISYHINSQQPLAEVIGAKQPHWLDQESKIIDIAKAYQNRKLKNNLMDFDDLLLNLLTLLEQKPIIKKNLATQFQYILVDEYQDTNYLQASIVKHLASIHGNILVVGDDAQSIYSFRAADIGNILNFPKLFPQAKVFKLETNYRSTPDILEVANDIISNNLNQYPKILKSVQESFVKPRLIPCNSAKQEAEFITSIVLQKQSEGVSLDQMSVLFRATHHSQFLEMELNRRGIIYDYRGGLRFFERAHIKDVVAYLKLLNNLNDEVSWLRVLNLQAGIGAVTADRIFQEVRQGGYQSLLDLAKLNMSDKLGGQALSGWESLCKIITAINKVKDINKVAEIIRAIIQSEYQEYLQAQYTDTSQRLDDLEQLALYAENYDNLKKFIDEVTLQDGFAVSQGKVDHSDEPRLILSTIHQAKGLEWDSVFIINIVENGLPNQRALSEVGGLEEERRLFYVAATRAQKYLFLTYPLAGGFDNSFNQMSQFLMEIDQKKIERVGADNNYSDAEMIIEIDENGERKSFLPDLDDL